MDRLRWRGTPVPLVLTLLLVACGGPPGAGAGERPTATAGTAFPVTVEAANGPVRIQARPERIVSLSPTSTEMLFAIGAGDQVVAADEFSDYPPEAPDTDLSGYEPNVEAIAGFEPDLVVLSDDVNDVVASLEALDVPVILHPAAETLEDTYRQIEQLGQATGNAERATEVVAEMRAEIERLLERAARLEEPLTYYHELDPTFFSVTSETFIGQIYGLVGLENIADRAEGGPYPQLSAEFIVEADPDLIFLADAECCGVTPRQVARRPGWDRITAVRTGAIVELDEDVASRWGPRIVELLRTVVEEVERLEEAA
ncbi:MAG TPA: ABC transporter substrate-binding protein [Actinomycetota bacterium]|nr:ABC transporter substrate-binding protein [Actinomycetota bacterium]